MNVDQKVHELACSFLDLIADATDKDRQELAEHIQLHIESWIGELEYERSMLAGEAEFQRSQRAVNELPGA
jgi:hypothetical protein